MDLGREPTNVQRNRDLLFKKLELNSLSFFIDIFFEVKLLQNSK